MPLSTSMGVELGVAIQSSHGELGAASSSLSVLVEPAVWGPVIVR